MKREQRYSVIEDAEIGEAMIYDHALELANEKEDVNKARCGDKNA